MQFEECMQKILERLIPSDADRESYTRDAQFLWNSIIERMKMVDYEFKKVFDGISLSGSYLDRLKIYVPDEFDLLIKLEMPFNIIPIADKERPGFMFLKGGSGFAFSKDGYIDRTKLQNWIRSILEKVISDELIINYQNHRYKLEYHKDKRGFGVAHTILIEDIYDNKRKMSFDLVPVFEFPAEDWPLRSAENNGRSWFAIPQARRPKDCNYDRTFMASSPYWEKELLLNKTNLKNSLRLMKALRDANGMYRLSSYMLKSIYLPEIDENIQIDDFWFKPSGYLLIHMLERLLECLKREHIPFYWEEDLNHLDRLSKRDILNYRQKLINLLGELKIYQNNRRANTPEIGRLFGITNLI